MRKIWRRIHFLMNRRRLERELAEEMEAHREMMSAERRGRFGSAARLREEAREAWSWRWFEELCQDLVYGIRVLSHAPGFTLGAVAVLALGVGANLAEFQIFDSMIFHRLSIRDAVSVLGFSRTTRQGSRPGFPAGAVEFYRAQSNSFAWLISEEALAVVVEGDPDLRSTLVSANYFGSLGIAPLWGRLLDARDAQPGAPAAAVLSYPYWQGRWGGDPHVVGRVVRINNKPVEIVGVLPYSFNGLWSQRSDVWFSIAIRPLLIPGSTPPQQDFSVVSALLFGKLKRGVPQAAGEAELTSLNRELLRDHPGDSSRTGERIHAKLLQGSIAFGVTRSPAIAIFVVMVLLILLSACANLGNMLLARGLVRQREIAIRLAIGASRARIVRQLMTENFLLAMLGAAAGLAFGAAAARLLMTAMGAPPDFRLSAGWPMLVAGFALTFLSAAVFGLPSALQTVRPNPRKVVLRQGLVGVQVAVSCLLLIASGVLAHNGILSASINLAFDYSNMVVVYPNRYASNPSLSNLNLSNLNVNNPGLNNPRGPVVNREAAANQKLDALSARLRTLPGVDGVTAAVAPPLSGGSTIDSLPGLPHIFRNAVAPSYFGVMNLGMVRGRTFVPGERNAVIVSESAARAVWPNQDPVGKLWTLAGAERTVMGVVKDSGANLLAEDDSIEAYVPIEGAAVERSALILHARGDPAPLVRMIPGAAAALHETVSVSLMRTGRDHALEAQQRMITLIGSIGVVATTLAAAGMFALVAFAVAQRKRELGIRIAIGARSRHILSVLLAQNARPTAVGALVGVVLAVMLSRIVRSLIVMPNRDTVDLAGFAGGLVCFLVVAALATLSPAMRALRIDPSSTLREE